MFTLFNQPGKFSCRLIILFSLEYILSWTCLLEIGKLETLCVSLYSNCRRMYSTEQIVHFFCFFTLKYTLCVKKKANSTSLFNLRLKTSRALSTKAAQVYVTLILSNGAPFEISSFLLSNSEMLIYNICFHTV